MFQTIFGILTPEIMLSRHRQFSVQVSLGIGCFVLGYPSGTGLCKWYRSYRQGHNVFSNTLILAVFPELYAIVALAATFLIGSALA